MKYKGTYFNMWDAWYLNVNDTIHAFHLKAHSGENWNVGHIYTKDLLHFKKMRDVLETLPEEKYPDDCLGKYTGCAIEKDGTYYLYYTMRDRFTSENIGLATSKDLEHFIEYTNNPVLSLDKELFVVREKGQKTDCRDMLVVFDEERQKYFGYFAAMANIKERGELGVIGVAESIDLINWSNQKIVYIPDFNGVVEVPNVFKIDGKWYMTLMTNTHQYGAKGAVLDPNLNSYIISAFSSAPDEIFKCCDDNVFLGSTRVNNGYALRCVEYKNKLYAMYIERSQYGSAISLPKEVKAINGTIKPYYSDILKELRTEKQWDNPEFVRIPTSFCWKNVVAGELHKNDEHIEVVGYKNSLQAFRANINSIKSLEVEFDISGDFEEAGLVLYCSENPIKEIGKTENSNSLEWNDYFWPLYISFNKANNFISLDKGMVEPINKRQFSFANKDRLHIRTIAMEGQLEMYVNDVLFLECGIETKKHIVPGLFSYSGKACISNFKIFELEN